MESEASAVPPEQALTEALLSLSWPLPRTVDDADAALTRLEQVKAVLTRLEQESVGTEAWWAGQVDGLATQSGFVLEWWRPVLADPDLDWTLNHQAHLTADLATLASAGARLLDQIEPRAQEEAAAAAHARRVAQERRWGPAAIPPFVPTGGSSRVHIPGARPQPPAQVFGDAAAAAAAAVASQAAAALAAGGQGSQRNEGSLAAGAPKAAPPTNPQEADTAPTALPTNPQEAGRAPAAAHPPVSAQLPQFPQSAQSLQSPLDDDLDAPEFPPLGAPRHRRPAYDFDDGQQAPASPGTPAAVPAPAPRSMPAAVYPQTGMPPRGVPRPPSRSPQSPPPPAYPPTGYPPVGYLDRFEQDDDEPAGLVPTGLRRHQRRLLMQTAAILAAIGVLCWWAVYTLSSSPGHPAAASGTADATRTGGSASTQDAAGGLSAPSSSPSPTGSAGQSSDAASPSAPPSTAADAGPDATSVSSVHVTLLGGSAAVPQIVALITVDTAGTGRVNVTEAYYGVTGSSAKRAAQTRTLIFSGHTAYQYSIPIANSAYCGTMFTYTLSAGGRSDTTATSPGC